ncbi:hypothetical protein HNP47_000088 [Brevundimonas vesicularis]|uniref:Pectate lyase superfamily protein n=1 Tax=Brevundimonas vesicularis TaxID=41276 RepID=A0A7W9FRA9_BREVE|nr:hypothetical protein [Brevundimonas vesicularis]MBB5770119.1 hypothetical protein [Brevundimonas vesicularis]
MAALPENDRIAGPFIAVAGQTDFPADFPLIDAGAVRVRRLRNGVATLLVSPDVSPVDASAVGFTCRLAVAARAGDEYWVYSDLRPERPRQHTPNGAIRSATLEDDAVALQAQLQERARDAKRSLSLPLGIGAADAEIPWAPELGERFLTIGPDGPRVVTRPQDFQALDKLSLDGGNADPARLAALRSNIGADQSGNVKFRRRLGAFERDLRDRGIDTVLLSDYGARGDDVTRDTDAFGEAIADFGAAGGKVLVPAWRDGPYRIDPVAINDMIDGAVPVEIMAQGESAGFQPASPLAEGGALFDLKSSLLKVSNFFITDPNGLLDDGFAMRTSQTVISELPIAIDGLFGVGVRQLLAIEEAYGVKIRNVFSLNCDYVLQVLSGGVDCWIQHVVANGFGGGIDISSDASTGVAHAEGMHIQDVSLIGMRPGFTGAHYGVRVRDTLWLKLDRCEALQMGPSGVGLDMDGTAHALAFIDDNGSYWEGGHGGAAIRSRGNNTHFRTRCKLGTGQITNVVKPLDIENANRFDIEVVGNALTGAARIYGSSGIVRAGTDLSSATGFTGGANDIVWECSEGRLPPGMTKELSSQYPKAAAVSFSPTPSPASGAFGALGVVTGRVIRDGRRARGDVVVNISNIGSASGPIIIALPYTAAGQRFAVSGLENGVTDKALTGVIPAGGTSMTVQFADGTTAWASNAALCIHFDYETA